MVRTVRLALGIGLIALNTSFSQDALPAPLARIPVLAELFTSEGCSSCPPADRLLQTLDTQPMPGIEIIVLSEHVDYWNHEGWIDPYSAPEFSERQRVYGDQFKLVDVYTPQLIVDGWRQTSGNKPEEVEAALRESQNQPKAELRITRMTLEQNRLSVQIESAPLAVSDVHSLDVYVVLALNHAENQVTRGENANRRLTHTAVVRKFKRVGKVTAGKAFSQDVELKFDAKTDPHTLRFVAFVQDPDSRKIFGSVMKQVE